MLFLGSVLVACEGRKPEKKPDPTPQVFVPAPAEDPASRPDTLPNHAVASEPAPVPEVPAAPQPAASSRKLPTKAELKTVSPAQEAKRSLSNDAMKAFSMKPEAFADYMKTRIPYYRGKGNLEIANDVVRITINAKEMQIETAKGRQVFPMQ